MDEREMYGFAAQLMLEGKLIGAAKKQYYAAMTTYRTQPSISAFMPALLAVRMILMSAGVVSTILWSPDEQRRERRRPLHLELGIVLEDAALLESRDVRNALMHIDERYEMAIRNMPKPGERLPWASPRINDPAHSLGGVILTGPGDDGEFIVMGRKPGDGARIRYIDVADAVIDVSARATDWLASKGVSDPYAH